MPDPGKQKGRGEITRAFDRLAIELNTRIRLLLTLLEREKWEERTCHSLRLPVTYGAVR